MGKIKISEKRRLANEARRKPLAALSTYMATYKMEAKKRNLNFCLSKEDFKKLVTGLCYYCGDLPKRKRFARTQKIKGKQLYDSDRFVLVNGIDRKNNKNGYTSENCLTCCPNCNYAKRNQSFDDFLNQIKKIYHNLF